MQPWKVREREVVLSQPPYLVIENHTDDLEEQELLLLSRAEVAAALARGEFKVMPWAANVALALLHLGS